MGSAGVVIILIRKPPFDNRLVKQGRRRFRAVVITPIEGKSFGPHWEVVSDLRSDGGKGGKRAPGVYQAPIKTPSQKVTPIPPIQTPSQLLTIFKWAFTPLPVAGSKI